MRVSAKLACLAAMAFLSHNAGVRAEGFDGITIIELADKSAGEAIKGHSMGSAHYLVTFVSANGSYAALGARHERGCIAWAQDGSYTGSAITFGIPPSEQSLRLVTPSVCQPFTLSLAGNQKVRLDAMNKHDQSGPLAATARELRHSGHHRVIARVPLVAFDWDMPVFSRYDIKGVSLGPLPALKGRFDQNTRFDLSPVQRTAAGARKFLTVTMRSAPNSADSTTVSGQVAVAEVLGWSWDVLYTAAYREYLPAQSLTRAFNEAVVERYGRPSREAPVKAGSLALHWFFDLQGRQLPNTATGPETCLSTREHWIDDDIMSFSRDIGPWGCALILLLTHNGADGTLSEYTIQAASGYVMGLSHFARRLEEVRSVREKIQKVQAYKPKL